MVRLAAIASLTLATGCALMEREPDPVTRGWVIPDPNQSAINQLLFGTRWVQNPYETPGAWDMKQAREACEQGQRKIDSQSPSALRGVCQVGHSGGPAGGGGQVAPAPQEGVRVVVRDSRGKKTIAHVTSGKGGEFEIRLPPGNYQIEADAGPGHLCLPCARSVEVRRGEITNVDLTVFVEHP
jgi:hypothetical protein